METAFILIVVLSNEPNSYLSRVENANKSDFSLPSAAMIILLVFLLILGAKGVFSGNPKFKAMSHFIILL